MSSNNPLVIMKQAAAQGDHGPVILFFLLAFGFLLPAIIGFFQERRNYRWKLKNCANCPNATKGGCWDGDHVLGRLRPAAGCSIAGKSTAAGGVKSTKRCNDPSCKGCPTCGSR